MKYGGSVFAFFVTLYIEVGMIAKGGNMDHFVPLPPYIGEEVKRVNERVGTFLELKPSFVKL